LIRPLETASGFVDTERKADAVSHVDQESKAAKPISRRSRNSFTDEFKAGAIRLVLDKGKMIPEVARDLDLTRSALRPSLFERARADRSKGKTGLMTAEREELANLRKHVRELTMERDILKEAAAYFAKHHM